MINNISGRGRLLILIIFCSSFGFLPIRRRYRTSYSSGKCFVGHTCLITLLLLCLCNMILSFDRFCLFFLHFQILDFWNFNFFFFSRYLQKNLVNCSFRGQPERRSFRFSTFLRICAQS